MDSTVFIITGETSPVPYAHGPIAAINGHRLGPLAPRLRAAGIGYTVVDDTPCPDWLTDEQARIFLLATIRLAEFEGRTEIAVNARRELAELAS